MAACDSSDFCMEDFFIDILGASFSISADEEKAYLEEVLSQYRTVIQNTQEMSGLQNPLKLAVLAGFLLCDEINKLKSAAGERAGEDEEVERRTMSLIEKIDRVLEENVSPAASARINENNLP